MSQTHSLSVELAAQIAFHVAEYENAWRTNDNIGMREHWGLLDTLCTGNPQASIIRGACCVAAASTRGTAVIQPRDAHVEHLQEPRERMRIISEYVEDLQERTGQELKLVA